MEIRQWDVFELTLCGELQEETIGENPYRDYAVKAVFEGNGEEKQVRGYYIGDGQYKVRFMPSYKGDYCYRIMGGQEDKAMHCLKEGTFSVTGPGTGNHGPVHVERKVHFAYEDKEPYMECGTTCYAWLHQREELREQTLKTLAGSPFNKIRFCIFPKHYNYNLYEPETYPYEGTPCSIQNISRENFDQYRPDNQENKWDFYRFNQKHFEILDTYIGRLMELGIQADIILFHPYDRWGFSQMGRDADRFYLQYVIARYGAFRNVWWSLANEYDLFNKKTVDDFEFIANVIVKEDCYCRLRSIHNCFLLYDFTKSWVTHCSIQRTEIYESAALTKKWRETYEKPIVLDEVGYEGDINYFWGNLTAEEMVRLFWMAAVRGGYCGHGETYIGHCDEKTGREVLWWSHGGPLHGKSAARLKFLQDILKDVPGHYLKPADFPMWNDNVAGVEDERYAGSYYLCYTGVYRPGFREFHIDDKTNYQVSVIDTWEMTVQDAGIHKGKFYITLPAKPYIAIRLVKSEQR